MGVSPIVLTVAGSDPSGGAGIQGDLKTIHQHGAYGAAAVTSVTVQNTNGVTRVEVLAPDLVRDQVTAVLEDMAPAAAKTGALGSPAIVQAVAQVIAGSACPWVVDPVWVPSAGASLAVEDLTSAYLEALIPVASVITPNAKEAAQLTGAPVATLQDAVRAAARIASFGIGSVLITGGHLEGDARGTDVLWHQGEVRTLAAQSIFPGEFHGTGCAFSAALACRLARGQSMPAATVGSKAWLESAMASAFAVGGGSKPINHFYPVGGEA